MPTVLSYRNTSPLEEQVKSRFKTAKLPQEYTQTMLVRSQALKLASQYGLDLEQVSTAALLHNISHLIPKTEYIKLAEEYGIEILPQEKQNPYLLHQKISRILAVEEFNISDKEILNAISCHTTLRKSATLLDKIIFLASKQNNELCKKTIFNKLEQIKNEKDLNQTAFSCLYNLLQNTLPTQTIHPWAQEALEELKIKL